MDITECANRIQNKHDFIQFIKLFHTDFQENRSNWENDDLERFFMGMERFLEGSTEDSLVKVDFTPSWKLFAKILIASSIYE